MSEESDSEESAPIKVVKLNMSSNDTTSGVSLASSSSPSKKSSSVPDVAVASPSRRKKKGSKDDGSSPSRVSLLCIWLLRAWSIRVFTFYHGSFFAFFFSFFFLVLSDLYCSGCGR